MTELKVVTKQELSLTPYIGSSFQIKFEWRRKKGVYGNYWFTPLGKCKVWIGCLNIRRVGKVDSETYKTLINTLKKHKTDVFRVNNSDEYYTTTSDDTISKIENFSDVILNAEREWDARSF